MAAKVFPLISPDALVFLSTENLVIIDARSGPGALEKYTQRSFLGFLMVEYKSDKPNFQVRSYKFRKTGDKFTVEVDPPMVISGTFPILFLGSYNAAVSYLTSHPTLFVGFEQILSLQNFMYLEGKLIVCKASLTFGSRNRSCMFISAIIQL